MIFKSRSAVTQHIQIFLEKYAISILSPNITIGSNGFPIVGPFNWKNNMMLDRSFKIMKKIKSNANHFRTHKKSSLISWNLVLVTFGPLISLHIYLVF